MEKDGIWQENWKVAAFMVDTNQQIRLKSIADILQELANNHANYRKCGFEDMKTHGVFWVLNRQVIEIAQWPLWEQAIRVESWISMMKGPFSLRNFAIYDDQGNMLVKAAYLWTCISREKMRPVTIPEGDYPVVESRDFEMPQPSKIKVNGDLVSEEQYTVRESDLDIIGHTNNAIYLEWASNILSHKNVRYQKVEANYTGESFSGHDMTIRLLQNGESILSVEVMNPEDKNIFKMKVS